ncbi:uncharacterized protein LOC6729126 [Drosophila simulans]|uniref:GD18445 n=1 Tax=Drosophila simulans TaxID=7240 RepID=B4R0M7_DROSI|nr:uncharacterized protein LOC6729126 [Drosophila simulans]EDX13950.1 GD18445 [Drosophila simulans]KMZ05141.1 uncharacterized protein Dsimw501_GD18445 [Drosophila simulans]
MSISDSSLNNSLLEVDEMRLGYDHESIKSFLEKSSIKDLFPYAAEIIDGKQLLDRMMATLDGQLELNLQQLLDLFTLSIMMMTFQRDNVLLMKERYMMVDVVCHLTESLDSEEMFYMASGLYENLITGVGMERLERVLDMQAAIPAMVKSCPLGKDVAMSLLLTIMGRYTGEPVELDQKEYALKAFKMAKTVNWRQLADSGRQADLFMLIRTFSMIINCKSIREECPDWKDNLGAEIHKYFLQVRMDRSAAYGDFEMMIERFIAYCVVRGASTTPQLCSYKISELTNSEFQ